MSNTEVCAHGKEFAGLAWADGPHQPTTHELARLVRRAAVELGNLDRLDGDPIELAGRRAHVDVHHVVQSLLRWGAAAAAMVAEIPVAEDVRPSEACGAGTHSATCAPLAWELPRGWSERLEPRTKACTGYVHGELRYCGPCGGAYLPGMWAPVMLGWW